MKRNNIFITSLIFIVLLVAFDQITKKLALHYLSEGSFPIFPGIFSLTLLEGGNSGAAFGLLKGGFWFFMISTFWVVFFALLFLRKIPEGRRYRPLLFSIVLLLAGAFGNLVDRVSTMIETGSSFVIDFLYFEYIDFPIFNVADCYISISAFLLIILGTFFYKEEDYDYILHRKKAKEE